MTGSVSPLSAYDYSCDGGVCPTTALLSIYPATDEYDETTGNNCTRVANSEALVTTSYVTNVCMKTSSSGDSYAMITCNDGDGARIDYSDSACTMETSTEGFDPCLEGENNMFNILVATCQGSGDDEADAIRFGFNFILMVFSVVFAIWSV